MPFSNYWFNNLAKDNFETFVKPIYRDRECKYLEIGSFEGASLLYMFENVLTLSTRSNAVVIDPFDNFNNCNNQLDVFKNNVQNYLDRTTILQGFSQNELPKLMPNTFDVIYIDGDHTSKGVLSDAILSFPLLKSGGLMIFDDYLWVFCGSHTVNNITHPLLSHPDNPYIGINTFLETNKDTIQILVSNWQVIICKL